MSDDDMTSFFFACAWIVVLVVFLAFLIKYGPATLEAYMP